MGTLHFKNATIPTIRIILIWHCELNWTNHVISRKKWEIDTTRFPIKFSYPSMTGLIRRQHFSIIYGETTTNRPK